MGKKIILTGLLIMTLLFVMGQESVVRYVSFSSQGTKLSGKLVMPDVQEPCPAVVFVVGGGGKASYRTTYARFVLENLHIPLITHNIAILLFDKRGVKPSQGNWASTTLCQRAEDVLEAVRFLKKQPGIDTTCIGVVGHCEGAWVAQIVAASYPGDVAFGVSLAGGVLSVRKQLQNQYLSQELCKGVSYERAQKRSLRKAQRTYSILPVMPLGQYRHLSVVCDFKPDSVITKINCPFLLLFAENDPIVYSHENILRLSEIFPHGVPLNFYVKSITGANHDFLLAPTCYSGNGIGIPYVVEFRDVFVKWVLEHIK